MRGERGERWMDCGYDPSPCREPLVFQKSHLFVDKEYWSENEPRMVASHKFLQQMIKTRQQSRVAKADGWLWVGQMITILPEKEIDDACHPATRRTESVFKGQEIN